MNRTASGNIPKTILDVSANELKRKILYYLSNNEHRTAQELKTIIQDHFNNFDETHNLDFDIEDDVAYASASLITKRTLRHCDILERTIFDCNFGSMDSRKYERWVAEYDKIRQVYHIRECLRVRDVNEGIKPSSEEFITDGMVLTIRLEHAMYGHSKKYAFTHKVDYSGKLFERLRALKKK